MGLYNYLGGHQVKCFTIPNIIITSDNKLDIYGLEGDFTYYKKGSKVPYKTLYYNYGENFLIFDYRGLYLEETPIIHIIKDGKYLRTVEYLKLKEEFFVNKVIDIYGNIINIEKYSDITNFIEELKNREIQDELLRKKYSEELCVVGYSMQDLRESKISSEKFMEDLEKRKVISDRITKELYTPFNNKWFIKEDDQIIGYILQLLKDGHNIKKYYDKLLEFFKENELNYLEMIKNYEVWVKENNIEVDTSVLYNK